MVDFFSSLNQRILWFGSFMCILVLENVLYLYHAHFCFESYLEREELFLTVD